MKTRICLLIGFLMLTYSDLISKEVNPEVTPSKETSINVFTTPELYQLTMKWAGEYGSLNPALKINVIKSSENEISERLKADQGIGFIAEETFALVDKEPNWDMIVGRDVIVPVMNAMNPFMDELSKKGVTREGLAGIVGSDGKQNWGTIAGNPQNISDIPIHFYTFNDAAADLEVANFLKTTHLNAEAIKTANEQEMITSIQKDPNGLGFCRLIQIIDPQNQNFAGNIKPVPIDKNGNGKIDYMENIYDNLQTFSRGVWIGKYPKALMGNIYFVSSSKPQNKNDLAFLTWVLTDGQQYLITNGYSDLTLTERKSQLDIISEPVNYPIAPENGFFAILKIILLALFTIILAGLALDAIFRRLRSSKDLAVNSNLQPLPVFDENSVTIPGGLYFDKTHTWAFMKKDGMVKIGIDDFLQHITGKITRIEMKRAGEKIKKGDSLVTIIQKGKQLKIYSPLSGTISTQNESLIENASIINASPYADGWVYTIEPTNWLLEIQFMNMADKYRTWLKNEFLRLKDFFATTINVNTPGYALITLQDGGALKDSVLADFGPEIWEDFQTKFIDVNRK